MNYTKKLLLFLTELRGSIEKSIANFNSFLLKYRI